MVWKLRSNAVFSLAFVAVLLFLLLITTNSANAVDKDNAKALILGQAATEDVAGGSDGKYAQTYVFETKGETELYKITVTNSTVNTGLTYSVYDANEAEKRVGYAGTHDRDTRGCILNSSKKHYIEITADTYSTSPVKGRFKILVEAVADDYPSTPEKARSISLNKVRDGLIEASEDEDWFKFRAAKDATYIIKTLERAGFTGYMNLHDGDVVYKSDVSTGPSYAEINNGIRNNYNSVYLVCAHAL